VFEVLAGSGGLEDLGVRGANPCRDENTTIGGAELVCLPLAKILVVLEPSVALLIANRGDG
jgi:hypothetical protein